MCGRFALGMQKQSIIRAVRDAHPELDLDDWIDEDGFDDRGVQDADKHHAVMQTMKWGVVPHWSKYEDKSMNTINAKAEHLVEGGGMWASIKGKKRCAVPCQGYYEWLKKGKNKLPHFTKHKDGKIMLLAGMYDCVTLEGETEPLWTFTIVTTDANKQMSWLHERMPVILSTTAQLECWLDTSSQTWSPKLSTIILPYNNTSKPLECYAVPTDVGKVGAESSTFIEPIGKRKDGIQAMFAKQVKKSDNEPSSSTANAQQSNRHDIQAENNESEKRKRESDSPTSSPEIVFLDGPDLKRAKIFGNEGESQIQASTGSKGKQEASGDPSRSTTSPNTVKSKQQASNSTHRSPRKDKAKEPPSPANSKITSFFSKSKR